MMKVNGGLLTGGGRLGWGVALDLLRLIFARRGDRRPKCPTCRKVVEPDQSVFMYRGLEWHSSCLERRGS